MQIAPPFKEASKWNFPGGVIEEGEDIIDGLRREIEEETGIQCAVDIEMDQFSTLSPKNDISIFLGTYLNGELTYQQDELLDSGWFSIDEALTIPLAFDIRKYLTNQISSPKLKT